MRFTKNKHEKPRAWPDYCWALHQPDAREGGRNPIAVD